MKHGTKHFRPTRTKRKMKNNMKHFGDVVHHRPALSALPPPGPLVSPISLVPTPSTTRVCIMGPCTLIAESEERVLILVAPTAACFPPVLPTIRSASFCALVIEGTTVRAGVPSQFPGR